MKKLTERQFYNVSEKKIEVVPKDFIEVVKFKNGSYALLGLSKNNVKMFKLISESKLSKFEKKFGKVRKYKK